MSVFSRWWRRPLDQICIVTRSGMPTIGEFVSWPESCVKLEPKVDWRADCDRPTRLTSSSQQFFDDATVDVGQSVVASGVPIGQACVVDPEQVQDGCVKVVNVDSILGDRCANLIR